MLLLVKGLRRFSKKRYFKKTKKKYGLIFKLFL